MTVLTTAPAPDAATEPTVVTAPTPAEATAVVAVTTAQPETGDKAKTAEISKTNRMAIIQLARRPVKVLKTCVQRISYAR